MDAAIWWGVFAPAGTSAAVIERVNRDIINIARQPEFIEKYSAKLGMDPVLGSPKEFADAIRSDVAIIAQMVKAANVKPIE
jgi:tripartite-type tricarboxylate transporter receptor subunit TctC